VLDHLDIYIETTADEERISRADAVTYLSEQGLRRADARELVEQLLLKGYLYEVDDGLQFQHERHGNRNRVERVFREVKRRTSAFANAFRNAKLQTAESWLQAFAVWHNSCQT